MTPDEVVAFAEQHGAVLESGKGPVPSVADTIAGEPVRGSWLAHEKGETILRAVRALRESDDILVCRLVKKKICFVHRRLWAALVRLAPKIEADHLVAIVETPKGLSDTHTVNERPFPEWVPESVWDEAAQLSEDDAKVQLATIGMKIK